MRILGARSSSIAYRVYAIWEQSSKRLIICRLASRARLTGSHAGRRALIGLAMVKPVRSRAISGGYQGGVKHSKGRCRMSQHPSAWLADEARHLKTPIKPQGVVFLHFHDKLDKLMR